MGVELFGEQVGVFQGVVGYYDVFYVLFEQVVCDQGDGFVGVDQQCLVVVQVVEDLFGQVYCGECYGYWVFVDGGIGVDGFCCIEGGLEQVVEQWIDGVGFVCDGVG